MINHSGLTKYKRLREHLYKRFKVNFYTGHVVSRTNGKVHCTLDSYGYIQVACGRFDGKYKMMKAHQIVFLLYHGYLPEKTIDHIDRNKTNNSINNLRGADYTLQARNKGHTGVVYRASQKVYRARIRDINHKQYEKTFKTYEEAIKWRKQKEQELWK